jgi:hypothetical protein
MEMLPPERAQRLYLLPEERPGAGPRRYRLARMEVVALATPPRGSIAHQPMSDGDAGRGGEEAGP